jgi:hypothetical protein
MNLVHWPRGLSPPLLPGPLWSDLRRRTRGPARSEGSEWLRPWRGEEGGHGHEAPLQVPAPLRLPATASTSLPSPVLGVAPAHWPAPTPPQQRLAWGRSFAEVRTEQSLPQTATVDLWRTSLLLRGPARTERARDKWSKTGSPPCQSTGGLPLLSAVRRDMPPASGRKSGSR